ncbi:MAG: undecaprenyldiphospho-muramoylpentapeptide beta-N-acetylglucosaminyltransferase [Chitinophagales bacterium]
MNKKIIISGGGTGGHVFPAIAIANALKKIDDSIDLLFVGAEGRIEMEKVPKAGYKIEGLWISGFERRLTFNNLSFPFKLVSSLWKSRKILKRFRPQVVVGVGGYASGPLLKMATMMGIPALIQEQNSFPGITNRLLAKQVKKVCVAYDGLERFFDKNTIVMTGNPVRKDIIELRSDMHTVAEIEAKKKAAIAHFDLNPDKKVLFVTAGSGGARGVRDGIAAHLQDLVEKDVQLIWQAGKYYEEDTAVMASPFKDMVKVMAFVDRMDLAFIAADAIVARAGATTIAELCIVGKPVVLMPSPYVTEDHQTANAKALVEKGAALMVRDKDAAEELGKAMDAVLFDKLQRASLSENLQKLAVTDAAERIAKEVLKLCL